MLTLKKKLLTRAFNEVNLDTVLLLNPSVPGQAGSQERRGGGTGVSQTKPVFSYFSFPTKFGHSGGKTSKKPFLVMKFWAVYGPAVEAGNLSFNGEMWDIFQT